MRLHGIFLFALLDVVFKPWSLTSPWFGDAPTQVCPHHGVRLTPSLFTPLGCISMGAVLFNGNVEHRGAAYLSELLLNVFALTKQK
jgi:hypothetical protein